MDAIQYCEEGHVARLREWVASAGELDNTNADGETALHVACRRGFMRCVRVLVAAGAALDIQDSAGHTPLLAALCEHHPHIAILLLHSGADVDIQNSVGDAAIHISARKGMLAVSRTLCALGCSLDTANNAGLYPLHFAARYGHIDIIRCLCLSGCNVQQRNSEGIKAEILAFKQCHYHVGELLNKLRISSYCESYIKQLMPTDRPLSKVNVKVLGEGGSGKSTLIRSLKAGYFVGLFARSKSQTSTGSITGKSGPSSPTNTHIEMDVTTHQHQQRSSEYPQYQYTRGIEIHQASLSSGEITLWDFSGLDTYFQIYDLFLGDTTSIYVITFNLKDPVGTQHYHCSFWLHFLTARLRPGQQLNRCGVRVILVGTHADTARVPRDAQGAFVSPLAQELRDRLAAELPILTLEPKVILVDSHLSNSQGLRDLKNAISNTKLRLLQGLLKWSGFLEAVMDHLGGWRRELEAFPVLTLEEFISRIHRNVNALAGEDHVQQLLVQLSIMGEAMILKSEPSDLVVVDVPWLCGPDVIGGLLSLESIARARLTGCYTEDDFQGAFPLAPAHSVLPLLIALQLCTQCENDDEMEFEFPCLNMVERLDGLWAAADERYSPPNSCYGGVRLKAPYKLLQTVFPRLQVQLRRTTIMCQDPDGDLYQWFRGSKVCAGDIEGLITLELDGQAIDIKVRATHALRLASFYFMEEILAVIEQVISTMAPGAFCERHIVSSEELRLHSENPHCWRPEHVLAAVLTPQAFQTPLHNPNINQDETVLQLVAFAVESVTDFIILGGDLAITELPIACQQSLARLLDPPDPLGRDWCLLAVKLGLAHKIALLDNEYTTSKTCTLLELWTKSKDATIGNLIKKLIDFGREDAAEVVMQIAPLFRVNAAASYDTIIETSLY